MLPCIGLGPRHAESGYEVRGPELTDVDAGTAPFERLPVPMTPSAAGSSRLGDHIKQRTAPSRVHFLLKERRAGLDWGFANRNPTGKGKA